jgi:hypothetical protein
MRQHDSGTCNPAEEVLFCSDFLEDNPRPERCEILLSVDNDGTIAAHVDMLAYSTHELHVGNELGSQSSTRCRIKSPCRKWQAFLNSASWLRFVLEAFEEGM